MVFSLVGEWVDSLDETKVGNLVFCLVVPLAVTLDSQLVDELAVKKVGLLALLLAGHWVFVMALTKDVQ